MNFYIVTNRDKIEAKETAQKVVDILTEKNCNCFIDEKISGTQLVNCESINQTEIFSKIDVVVTVGGDGTFLHTAAQILDSDISIVGVNTGRLGFLTQIEVDELDKLNLIVEGKYKTIKRKAIKAQYGGNACYALNDISLCSQTPLKTIRYSVYSNGVEINSYRGDGVIVATPTGSTAYNLSAGGPIIDAEIECVVVTPVCAHSLNTPPVVFSKNRTINIKVTEMDHKGALIVADGEIVANVLNDQQVEIKLSEKSANFIKLNKFHQFKAIDQKLKRR